MNTAQLVSEYLVQCRENGSSPSTLALKQSILGRFAQDCPDLPQAPTPIFQFLATMGKSQATRKSARDRIRAFYTFASREYDLPDPMPEVAVPLRGTKRAKSAQVMHRGGVWRGGVYNQAINCPACGAAIYFGGNSSLPRRPRPAGSAQRENYNVV